MADDRVVAERRTPWHLWVVGIVALLWNLVGAYDYLMTQTQNEAYMGRFTAEQLEYFYGFPTWVVATWAIAVWGALLGAILLLLRKRLAAPVFLVSFISMIVTSIYNFGLSDGARVMGTPAVAFSAVIFLFALGLWLYARAMVRQGVLT
ncbi:MAG: hypothetical protein P8125_10795 [Gemmatimonadota bacterium]